MIEEDSKKTEYKIICTVCGSDKSSIRTRVKGNHKYIYPDWYHNPEGEGKVCKKCYEKINYRLKYSTKKLAYLREKWINDVEWRTKELERNRQKWSKNKAKYAVTHQQWYLENAIMLATHRRAPRLALITLLSVDGNPRCIECAYDADIRALCVEHIKGGGTKERKKFRNIVALYEYYLNHPQEAFATLQILCANCNQIKKHSNTEWYIPSRRNVIEDAVERGPE